MADTRPFRRALRAYERLDAHFRECVECDDYGACEVVNFYWAEARALRRMAMEPRRWRSYELGLRPDLRPVTTDDGPVEAVRV